MLEVGSPAPDFELRDETGKKRRLAEFKGSKLLLVFYPGDFSPVCSDQLSVYQEVLPELEEAGVQMVAVSVDSGYSHAAFKEKLGLGFPLLSDFHPKGEASQAYEAYFEPAGFSNRSLVLVDEEGKVAWAYEAENPGELPGANLIFDALEA
jgi:peroxiredoxin